jgi:hypothetical protein
MTFTTDDNQAMVVVFDVKELDGLKANAPSKSKQ